MVKGPGDGVRRRAFASSRRGTAASARAPTDSRSVQASGVLPPKRKQWPRPLAPPPRCLFKPHRLWAPNSLGSQAGILQHLGRKHVRHQTELARPVWKQLVLWSAFGSGGQLKSWVRPWRHQAHLWPVRPPAPPTSHSRPPGAQRGGGTRAANVHTHATLRLVPRPAWPPSWLLLSAMTIPAGGPTHTGPELHPSIQNPTYFWLQTQSRTACLL